MANTAYRACGNFCVINELCRRVGVPVYPDENMIGPKAPINASTIRRLQHHHPTKAIQNDEEDNARNDEEFFQLQVQEQQVKMQGQQALEIQRRMEAHAVGVTR